MELNISVATSPQARSQWRRLVRWGFLPVMLVGVNGTGWWLASRGAPKWQIVVLLLVAIGVSFAGERVVAYLNDWNRSMGDARRDVAHAAVNEALQILSLLSLPVMVELLAIEGIWPTEWPFVVQVVASIIVVDFGVTVGHWLSHRFDLLWRFHAVHHTAERFYGLNGLMKHPFHQLFETALGTAPLVLLGIPAEVATAVVVAVTVQLLLQHSNVDYVVAPPLRWLLALNHVHRFHHLKWAGDGDVNFGLFTTLWDRVVGTAVWDPARTFDSAVLGIAAEPDFPRGYNAQLLKPFQATRAARAARAR